MRVPYDRAMEEVPGKQERGPYNARRDFEGVRNAIAEVEGVAWLNGEKKIAEHWDEASEGEQYSSLEGARRWLETVSPEDDVWHTVYGSFGVDRWFVHADGSIRFSKFHASEDGLRKATLKGFWIE